ncbi:sporulation peptidase YabG [Paenibacillus sp. 1P07SE]|uniref:sporulation peptidase YabG n=1 Tax=Paenibacillus sp. 1P07SE TaxID=3132209 RepID=UPI0039A5F3F1
MKLGDLVVRNSYGGDVLFRVEELRQAIAVLKGTDYRLLADAPVSDLSVVPHPETARVTQQVRVKVSATMQRMVQEQVRQQQAQRDEVIQRHSIPRDQAFFELPGRVLHLDGDGNYMKKSMQLYQQMRVPAHGMHANEAQMPELLQRLLPQVRPDIVVITGHDGVLKHRPKEELYHLSSYKNSQNFVNAVRVARAYEKSRDGLIVVAGACQSHFEALLQAGANFASSPGRILIHALDPVYIAIKSSYTPMRETINLAEVIQGTISGVDGVGGIETMGRHRVGMPKPRTPQSAVTL